MDDPYQRYAERLDWLRGQPDALAALVDRIGAAHGWWQGPRVWQRRWLRFDPGRAPYASVLVEADAPQALCRVQFHEHDGQAPVVSAQGRSVSVVLAPMGRVQLDAFPHDPRLPGLPGLLQGLSGAQAVRYRPGMRCTLRGTADDGEIVYAKVFADANDGAVVHAAGRSLWAAAARGVLGFRVAPPRRYDAAASTLWQGVAPGDSAKPALLGTHGLRVATQLGHALASVQAVAFDAPARYDAAWQYERSADNARELKARMPGSIALVDEVMAMLAKAHAKLEPRALQPIHGAPHPSQWLIEGEPGDDPQANQERCSRTPRERYSLVDFDRCGLGDPELDVATFMAEVDFERGAQHPVAAVNAAFVRGFESAAGALDPARLALYRAHKHVARALRHVRGIRADAPVRAAKVLQGCIDATVRSS